MKINKLILLLQALSFGALSVFAEDICNCDGGTTAYKYDCDKDIPGDDSCEPCCNSDAGDPKHITENIDYDKEMTVGPFDIDLPGGCGTITIPELVKVQAKVKGNAEGIANPLEIPITSSISGTPSAGIGYSLSANGNVKRYVYIECVGDDCVGPNEGGSPSHLIDFSISFTVKLCSLANWTTPDIFLYRDEKDYDPVEYEVCGGS